jgi:hypothetical protein
MKTKAEMHRDICGVLSRVYEEKNERYGDSFGKTYCDLGIISAVTRMTDKLNRATQLAASRATATEDESIKDTLLDLANYAIMTIIELERERG